MRSFLDTEANTERAGEKAKFGRLERAGILKRPLSSVGVKGAESGDKLRTIRRPFHPDVQFLRIYTL
jgi:hypothetical protein